MERWIGKEVNSSGSYYQVGCDELSLRHGGTFYVNSLYRFKSRFGVDYYISDEDVIGEIEDLIRKDKDEAGVLYEYLYSLVIQRFGAIEFITRVGHKIAEERSEGYKKGKRHMQEQIRDLLGLDR